MNRIACVEEMIKEECLFLITKNYLTECNLIEEENLLEGIEISYVNTLFARKINFSYTNRLINNVVKFGFHVSITRLPYNDERDFFSVGVYLSSKGKHLKTVIENHFDIDEAKAIVHNLAGILKEDLSDIVTGEKWLEDYYPKW